MLLFADDAVLIASQDLTLQRLILAFEKFCGNNKLKVNAGKTKVMLINCSGSIYCNDVKLQQVNKFKYLGLVISALEKAPFEMVR